MSRPKRSVSIGPLSTNSASNTHYIPERIEFDIPGRITNASTKSPLVLSDYMRPSGMRAGCDDHARFRSLMAMEDGHGSR